MDNQEKKIKIRTIVFSAIILVIVYIVAVGILIYVFGINNELTRVSARVIPYPAALINSTHFVSVNEMQNNLQAVQKFYENQDFSDAGLRVDFSTQNGQKRLLIKKKEILNKLIENKIIEMLANARGITVTPTMVSQAVNQEIAQYGDQNEAANNLQKLYGWSISDFEEKLVKPDLYQAALENYLGNNDPDMQKAKTKIEAAANDLKNGKDFTDVASQYSDGESAKNGGELGWFSADQMLPQLAAVAFSLPTSTTSDVIKSPLGYHIIIVDDKKTENGVDEVRIRQIFAKTQTFADWLTAQEKNIKIFIPIKDFFWDNQAGAVEFRNADMKQFEDNLDNNSAGDASVLF